VLDARVTLHVLLDLHRMLAREHALDAQLQLVARAALSLLEADHASIRVLEETGTELLSGARAGSGIDHEPVTFGRGLGIAGWVVDHGEPVRLDEVSTDPRYVPVSGQGFEIRSMLAVPLTISAQVIGVLSVTSRHPAAFGDAHEDLALLLAGVAASPIERARLETIALGDPASRAFGARYLAPRLAGEVHRAREAGTPLSVISLELEPLAAVRRDVGRTAADALLRVAVDRILSAVAPAGVVVRRDGGELVVLLPGMAIDDAEGAADAIAEALAMRVTELGAAGESVDLAAGMGVAEWNGMESPRRLERRADEAMRAARARGPGSIAVWEGAELPG